MRSFTLFILMLLSFASALVQNKELDLLLFKYKNNTAVEYQNSKDSIPDETGIKVLETLDFSGATGLIPQFVSEYEHVKGFKKTKATKMLNVKGNMLMKYFLNKSTEVRLFESENGYKDMVIEFDGCAYVIMHIGGFFKEKDIAKYISITGTR